ncbi:MAG: glycoside hydrolase family 26 protein [Chloroflexota bacterium]
MKRLSIKWLIALLGAALLGAIFLSTQAAAPAQGSIYWGAYIKGNTYGLNDAPWNPKTIARFEEHAQKKPSIIHWGQPWWDCRPRCGYRYFGNEQVQFERVRRSGYIPMVDWASWDLTRDRQVSQPKYALQAILRGDHDAYIRDWAAQARDWGHPFFLRFNWEMNGDWYPWSERVNGNQPGEYVQVWRYVHDIFEEVGAKNVTWVWCVNTLYEEGIPLEGLYPGDAYVDWTCIDGYNRGDHPLKRDQWRSFEEVFGPTYEALLELAPTKPIMIGEVSSTEYGGSKAEWIRTGLLETLPQRFPKIKAIVWFNWNHRGMDWVIESSADAQAAFAQGINSSYYAGNEFSYLDISPIPPPDRLKQIWQRRWRVFP